MANVIIAPEHQSAPRGYRVTDTRRSFAQDAPAIAGQPALWHRDYDTEMDMPTTARQEAAVRRLQQRDPAKSTEAMIEEALRQHAINEQKSKPFRWEGQERWQGRENEEMRLVNILHPHGFIAQLRRAGIAASVDDPYEWLRQHGVPIRWWPRGQARLWLNSFSKAGRIGVTAWVNGDVQTITTLQYPYGPEWSIMRFDAYNVPTNEKYRGWRTALLALVFKDVLTEAEVNRAFGRGAGPASEFYQQQMQQHRTVSMGMGAVQPEEVGA